MYTVEYLPVAKKDMVDIVTYISKELQNPLVAEKFAIEMVEKIEGLARFPYSNSAYFPIRKLKREYRKLQIKNFIAWYYVDEETKIITVSRVLYSKRDVHSMLDT